MTAPERMPTGIRGLDQLLEGGLVRENSLLIEGQPGSGKSTLGIRILYEGALRYNEPGLLISFEEFPRQIYAETAACGMDLQALEAAGLIRVLWTPPSRVLDSFRGKSDLVEGIVEEMGVRRLLIDSVTHFKRIAAEETELREILSAILTNVKLLGVNAILIKELEFQEHAAIAFEEYLVDASLRLYMESGALNGSNRRLIEIRKTRGQGHVAGRHPFRLDANGLSIFPRYRRHDVARAAGGQSAAPGSRVSSGVQGLDDMLCGGFLGGESAAVSGYAGSGKSVLAHHYLDDGLTRGETALLLSFRGDSAAACRTAQALGMSWTEALASGTLQVCYHHPLEVTLEEVIHGLFDTVRQRPPDRFVCDSIGLLAQLATSPEELRDQLGIIVDIMAGVGSTALYIQDTASFNGEPDAGQQWFSQLVSTVIKLSIAETDGVLRRFIAVAKHAESDHAKELREIAIDATGLHVAESGTALAGVLTGQAHRAARELSAEILPALAELHRSLEVARMDAVSDPDLRQSVLAARQHAWAVDRLLREYFGGVGPDDSTVGPDREARRARILVVEDNAVNQQVAVRILERMGHSVDVVGDGSAAIGALGDVDYDVVLMDLQMPIMTGLEATSLIRDKGSTVLRHDVPIIALTAAASSEDQAACLAAGMDDYLAKPLAPDTLRETLRRWLPRAR